MKRGIVTLPTSVEAVNAGRNISTGRGLRVTDLNFFSLYWDEIIIPNSDILVMSIEREAEFISAGILSRPVIPSPGGSFFLGEIASTLAKGQIHYVDKKRKEDPEADWRLSFIGDGFQLGDTSSEIKKSIRLELTNALPVPDASVNIADILEFKQRRRDELEAFNSSFDELYLEVVNSGDLDLSKKVALARVKKSLEDLEKLNAQTWRSPIKFDASEVIESNVAEIVAGFHALEATWSAAHGNVMSAVTLGSIALGTAMFGKVKLGFQSIRNRPQANMAYLANAHREGIIKKK